MRTRDIDRALVMAVDYHADMAAPWPLDLDALRDVLERVGGSPQGFLRISDTGFCAGVIERHPLSPEWVVAKEVFWWRDADLIRQFRAWAKRKGANEIHYSCPPDKARVRRFYSGFSRAVDVTYSEVL